MLSVLDLFSREHESLTAEDISDKLKLTRSTCYRYTRELSGAGLLVNAAGAYSLGPRIIQLDHRIRQSDPLLNAAKDRLSALASSVDAVGLLATVFKSEIINIFECGGESTASHVTYRRGTTVPTFKGSSSKVIIASFPRARLKRLWTDSASDPDCLAIGDSWKAFWTALQLIKKNGHWISRSEIDPEIVGMSAPIFRGDKEVAGSITLIFKADAFSLFDPDALGERLTGVAAEISAALSPAARSASS